MAATIRDLDTSIPAPLRDEQRTAEQLDDQALAAELLRLRRERSAVAGREAALLAELEYRRSHTTPASAGIWHDAPTSNPLRHRTSTLWLAAETRERSSSCGRVVRRAEALADLPTVHAALLGGRLSEAHVDKIAWAHRQPHMGDHVVDAQATLCRWAAAHEWPDFAKRIEALVEAMDTDDPADKALQIADKRGITSTDFDGRSQIVIDTSTEAKHQIYSAIAPLVDAMRDGDFAEAREAFGDEATWAHVHRTDPQRLHDALLQVVRAGATANDPGAAFNVDVVVDLETLEREAARACGVTPEPLDLEHALAVAERRACETLEGTTYNPAIALAAALSGSLRRVVLGAADAHVDMSVADRTFRGLKRRAVQLRDRHCAMPGCDRPSHECEIDHIVPHTDGGPTETANGQPLCRPCHRWKTWLDALGFP